MTSRVEKSKCLLSLVVRAVGMRKHKPLPPGQQPQLLAEIFLRRCPLFVYFVRGDHLGSLAAT